MIAVIAVIADIADKCEGRPAHVRLWRSLRRSRRSRSFPLVSQRFLAKSRTASVVLNDSRISESRPAI